MSRLRGLPVLIGFCAVLLVTLVAPPASAHAELLRSDPAAGAVLDTAPAEVRLTFSEAIAVVPDSLRAFGPAGAEISLEGTAVDAAAVVDLPDLGRGTWVVVWRVISEDGHPVAGALRFSVGGPSAGTVTPPVAAQDRALVLARGGLRALAYLGGLLVTGLVVFLVFVAPGTDPGRLRWVLRAAGPVASLAALLLVPVGQQRLNRWWGPGAADDWLAWSVLTAGLTAGLAVPRLPARVRRAAAAAALLAPASFALVGHSRATEPLPLVALADITHAVAGAAWLGGLVGLVVVLARPAADVGRAEVLARFSALAAASLLALAGTGVVLAWRILGSWAALTTGMYGRLLLVKLALVGVAAGVAAWNRWWLLPRARRPGAPPDEATGGAHRLLGRGVRVEAALVLGAVVVTAALVDRAPEKGTSVASGAVVEGHAPLADHHVGASVAPGRVGVNTLTLELVGVDGAPVRAVGPPSVRLRAGRLDLGEVVLVRAGAGRWTGRVDLPHPGRWELQVAARLSTYSSPVAVLVLDVPG